MNMPTYEYTCQKCGHQFEHVQSMTATPLEHCLKEVCPKARWAKGKVARGIGGGAGLIFKGSGFYITDYRSEGYKASAKADSAAPAPKTDAPKAEAPKVEKPKPAEKPKPKP